MNDKMTLAQAAELVKPWAVATRSPGADRIDVEATVENLLPAVTALAGAHWGYLGAITGLDLSAAGAAAPTGAPAAPTAPLEVLYHFCSGPSVLTLRVKLPRASASVPTLGSVVPPAMLYERELSETFGVQVVGLPAGKRQYLSDDWPKDLPPMRKEFSSSAAPPIVPGVPTEREIEPGEVPGTFIVPIGPQHPALKEPGHFELSVDGEVVTHASVRLGYVHRGIEKGAEDRSWVHNVYLMERICGICSHIHATAYSLGVEKLAGVAAPPRAQVIRTIFAEMERVHSHLLWLGVAAHEAGFDTLFMYSWRDRETIMDLLESISGNRVNYSVNLLGGVKFDIDQQASDALRRGLDYLEKRSHHYMKIVTTDESFLRRTRGVGSITHEQADFLGTVGPTARASGVSRDLRVDAPYAAYGEFPVKAVLDPRCDLAARFVVRINELFESYRVLREMLDKLPGGDLAVTFPRRVPEGETVSRVEAPRGELFYFLRSTGGTKPDRVKVRTPSLCNWAAVLSVAVGHKLADIPMILVGIDPCFSCNDRSIVVRRKGDTERWTWEELRQYGIRYYGGGEA